MGGPRLRQEGLEQVVDARELLAMGFVEVLSRLPRIREALEEIVRAAEREKPDLAIVIDYPDFHFRLARRLRQLGIPVVYYIPPKVWVWRKRRLEEMRTLFSRILSILPFEEEFYRKAGVPVTYVGNPLADELPLDMTREKARETLGLRSGDKVLVAMPGSRPSELNRHTELMLDASVRVAAELRRRGELRAAEPLIVLMPVPVTAGLEAMQERVRSWLSRMGGLGPAPFILDVRVTQGNSAECLIAADAGLIKSGTSTLEAALLGCPHAIVYRTHWLTSIIYRAFVRYRGPVGLTNLVAAGPGARGKDQYLAPEILLDEATPEALSREAVDLLLNASRRERVLKGLREVRSRLLKGSHAASPSAHAAEEVLQLCRTS